VTQDDRIRAAQQKLERAAADTTPRNAGFTLVKGNLYRIRSRNLPYGVYDGNGGFIGIREKFGSLYLFTEYDYDTGPPYGTVIVVEDLGSIPEEIEPVEGWWSDGTTKWPSGSPRIPEKEHVTATYEMNAALYQFLSEAEQDRGRGEGYGGRPGDDPGGAGMKPRGKCKDNQSWRR